MAVKHSGGDKRSGGSAQQPPSERPQNSNPRRSTEQPSGFVVNDSLDIVEFLGNTGPYLRMSPGPASLGLRNVLQAALQSPVCRAIDAASTAGHAAIADVSLLVGDERRKVDIEVTKSFARPSRQVRYRILIREVSRAEKGAAQPKDPPAPKPGKRSAVARLEQELADERLFSKAALAERDLKYDDPRERLQAANRQLEEVAARAEEANAELRATTDALSVALEESQRSEQRLRESEERFRLLADNAPVLIWVHDTTGCEFVNREYLDFLGCSMEDVLGTGWARYAHPDDAAEFLERYRVAFQRQKSFEQELRLRRADGEYRWLRATGVPRFTAEGTFLGYVGCSVDITDIKESEAALKEAARRKDEFLAMLGHELRNPLAAVRTGTLLLQAKPSEERRAWIENMIDRQVNQLQRLVDDLLDVTRIARGKFQLQLETVEIRRCIEPAIEVVRKLLDQRRHQLIVSLPPEDLYLEADCSRVEQIVVNLLTNAAKYTQEGGTIRLSAGKVGGDIVVRCKDNGIGLLPDMVDSIFEPFTQANTFRDSTGSGLGIGLALARTLAEMHGGSIVASSVGLGKGSEFILRLPARESRDSGVTQPAAKAPVVSSAPAPLQVLLVDDNRDLAQGTALFLESQGHRIAVASDGATGLSLAEQNRPDVVLLDIGLPDMNGHAVAARMRTIPCLKDVTIVAISGFKPNEEQTGGSGHFDAHLVKPFKPDKLLDLLQKIQSRRSPQRILLIEDNPDLAQLTAEMLRGHGQDVRVALNGREGLEIARQFQPRIVFCDLNLPDINGIEVARILREQLASTSLLLVGVSAAAMDGLEQHGGNSAFDLYWSKPLKWDQIQTLLVSGERDSRTASV